MFNTSSLSLPAQMVPLSKKNKAWKEANLDALEQIGRLQYVENQELLENYQMLKGKFIFKHYLEKEDYKDLVSQLSEEFDIPVHLRHYDIISQVVNTLSGEYQARPDLFRVRDYSEECRNNYRREKTGLLMEYVKARINEYVQGELAKQGIDPQKEDFNSEEEKAQYQEEVNQKIQELTPPEIQKYMDMDWLAASEVWGENQLAYDNEKYKRSESERILFEDMLAADRAFKHFYVVPDGYNEEVWNTVNTFFQVSPDIYHIEDGDYVGRIIPMTVPEIINRYGFKMTENQILQLERYKSKKPNTNDSIDGINTFVGTRLTPGTVIPYDSYPQETGTKMYLGPRAIDNAIGGIYSDYIPNSPETFLVTEAYWMSQQKIGKFTYQDSETGQTLVMLVDETFNYKLIPGVKVKNSSFVDFSEEEESNTLVWTWVNQVWKGIKINNASLSLKEPIYVDIRPNDYQFKGDTNIYGAKLPVCGSIFNGRYGESASLVSLMKPDQIGHNIAANQLYEIMQKEIGKFMLMDVNLIPSTKDWGGEGNYEKLMSVAKWFGVAPVDGSQTGAQRTNFAHFQQLDLDESARMKSRMEIANYFEQKALSRVGITPQRLGAISASETATGVQEAVSRSYSQTESYFTRFSEFKKRYLQMSLDIAQYVQVNKIDVNVMNIKSDLSRGVVEIKGTDLLNAELGLFVSDSQELQRQLSTLRQLFLSNNTTGATPLDLAEVILSNSPDKIKAQLETSWKQSQAQQQQAQQQQQEMQEKAIEAQQQSEQLKMAKEDERLDKKLANERYIAEVRAVASGTFKSPLGMDQDNNNIPDALEVQKFNAAQNNHDQDILFKNRAELNKQIVDARKGMLDAKKLKLEEQKIKDQKELKEKEFKLKEKEMKNDLLKAKYNDKGKYEERNSKKDTEEDK